MVPVLAVAGILVALGGLLALGVFSPGRSDPNNPPATPSENRSGSLSDDEPDPAADSFSDTPSSQLVTDAASPGPTSGLTARPEAAAEPGSFRYPLATRESLTPVLADGSLLLQADATRAFWRMQGAARRAGIRLYTLRGYVDVAAETQYWQSQDPSLGEADLQARVALRNYHSVYGIDIGDYQAPDSDRSPSFQETEAFGWLAENAEQYGFVPWTAAVALETLDRPWHWHYEPESGDGQVQ
ncbi:MAG: D-alanyl-D-alanine carboxypeptidase family protein [Prochlorothrix sp.]